VTNWVNGKSIQKQGISESFPVAKRVTNWVNGKVARISGCQEGD
jgi:hypothetical protein